MGGIRCQSSYRAREDQPATAWRIWSALVRMAAMHDASRAIESGMKKFLVGFDGERSRHSTRGIGDHPVCGYYGVAFDPVSAIPTPAGLVIREQIGRVTLD